SQGGRRNEPQGVKAECKKAVVQETAVSVGFPQSRPGKTTASRRGGIRRSPRESRSDRECGGPWAIRPLEGSLDGRLQATGEAKVEDLQEKGKTKRRRERGPRRKELAGGRARLKRAM